MLALAFVLLVAGLGLLLAGWGKREAARKFWDLVDAFEVDIGDQDDDQLQDDDE